MDTGRTSVVDTSGTRCPEVDTRRRTQGQNRRTQEDMQEDMQEDTGTQAGGHEEDIGVTCEFAAECVPVRVLRSSIDHA